MQENRTGCICAGLYGKCMQMRKGKVRYVAKDDI